MNPLHGVVEVPKRRLIVNRQTRWGLCGYLERDGRKHYMKWVNIDQAMEEAVNIYNAEVVNRIKLK
jgi:hypothetical protein